MPQLDPTWFASQLFWLAITFVALYFTLARFVLPPLEEVIARRRQSVEDDLGLAQQFKSQAEQARQEYERLLADARRQSQQLFIDAQAAQKARAESANKTLDQAIEKKLAEASQRIAEEKKKLTDGLAPAVSELTGMIVEKLTRTRPASDQVARAISGLSKGSR